MYVQVGAQKFRWISRTFFRRMKIVLLYLYINQYVLTDLIESSKNFMHKILHSTTQKVNEGLQALKPI